MQHVASEGESDIDCTVLSEVSPLGFRLMSKTPTWLWETQGSIPCNPKEEFYCCPVGVWVHLILRKLRNRFDSYTGYYDRQ